MSDPSSRSGKPSLGADLVIPGLGVALALYFFTTVAELPWEAKANALAIGLLLLLLVAIFVMRIVRKVMRGDRKSTRLNSSHT